MRNSAKWKRIYRECFRFSWCDNISKPPCDRSVYWPQHVCCVAMVDGDDEDRAACSSTYISFILSHYFLHKFLKRCIFVWVHEHGTFYFHLYGLADGHRSHLFWEIYREREKERFSLSDYRFLPQHFIFSSVTRTKFKYDENEWQMMR